MVPAFDARQRLLGRGAAGCRAVQSCCGAATTCTDRHSFRSRGEQSSCRLHRDCCAWRGGAASLWPTPGASRLPTYCGVLIRNWAAPQRHAAPPNDAHTAVREDGRCCSRFRAGTAPSATQETCWNAGTRCSSQQVRRRRRRQHLPPAPAAAGRRGSPCAGHEQAKARRPGAAAAAPSGAAAAAAAWH